MPIIQNSDLQPIPVCPKYGSCVASVVLLHVILIQPQTITRYRGMLLGLESWEFFVSWYFMKFRDDIVILWYRRGISRSIAGSAPSCSSSESARKLTMSVSSFLLLDTGCTHDCSSRLVCSASSYTAQYFVHMCSVTDHFRNHNVAAQWYQIVMLWSPQHYRRSRSYDSGPICYLHLHGVRTVCTTDYLYHRPFVPCKHQLGPWRHGASTVRQWVPTMTSMVPA